MTRLAVVVVFAVQAWAQHPEVVLIVLDGCRPDYVSPEVMPNVHGLGARGVTFCDHHAVFPTLTRVNSPSIATGCYPEHHGLLGNSIYVPEVDPGSGFGTGNAVNLMKVVEATGGKLLTAPSLGEILEANGKTLVAVSAGSSGSAFLLNPTLTGGGVVNVDLILPESRREAVETAVGPAPEEATPNDARNRWIVDVLLEYAIPDLKPDVALVWFSDPDHTAHEKGMGDPVTVDALKKVDREVGRLLDGLAPGTNVIITSDHGFSTNVGGGALANLLVDGGMKLSADSNDVVVVDGGIYVREGGIEKVKAIVDLLQQTPWIGAIFTKPIAGQPVEGTLPLDAVRWNHPRSADILVAAQWTDAANDHGFQGTTALPGVATHGNCSPWDIHNIGFAAGPAFKGMATIPTATGNVDWAPTILRLLELRVPETMDGRVLEEGLRGGPTPQSLTVERKTDRASRGSYELVMQRTWVAGYEYFDFAQARRTTEGASQ